MPESVISDITDSAYSLIAAKMNKNAKRIHELRTSVGLSDVEVANQVGIGIHAYCDLESYDEEIIEQVSLSEALRLAAVFQISLLELLEADKLKWPKTKLSPIELRDLLKKHIDDLGSNQEQVENEVGWYLASFLANPTEEMFENPISFIQDICSALEIDWLQCIPSKGC